MAEECGNAMASNDLQQNLLIVLTVSNIALLFLVSLLSRRLEALHIKFGRFIKSSLMQSGVSITKPQLPTVTTTATNNSRTGVPVEIQPQQADPTRDILIDNVVGLRKTRSDESIKSSVSADDFAALQCMLGEEDGVTM